MSNYLEYYINTRIIQKLKTNSACSYIAILNLIYLHITKSFIRVGLYTNSFMRIYWIEMSVVTYFSITFISLLISANRAKKLHL